MQTKNFLRISLSMMVLVIISACSSTEISLPQSASNTIPYTVTVNGASSITVQLWIMITKLFALPQVISSTSQALISLVCSHSLLAQALVKAYFQAILAILAKVHLTPISHSLPHLLAISSLLTPRFLLMQMVQLQ